MQCKLSYLEMPQDSFFNKAANEKSQRTLLSYAKGELADHDEGFSYIRNGNFTSLIAMEVYDTIAENSFTIGLQIDVANDNSHIKKFFVYHDEIPENHFINNNMVMDIGELKAYAGRKEVRLEQFDRQKAYRETLRAKLGNVNEKFFSLFKKAVPFTPISDIKGFITEFICDTENKIDIKSMQDNIRHYEKMKLDAEDIEKQIDILGEISSSYKIYKKLMEEKKIDDYTLQAAKEKQKRIEIEKTEERQKKKSHEVEEIKREISFQEEKIKTLRKERDSIEKELRSSTVHLLEKEYKEKKEQLEKDITLTEANKKRIILRFIKVAGELPYKLSVAPASMRGNALFHTQELQDIEGKLLAIEKVVKEEQLEKLHSEDLIAVDRKLVSWKEKFSSAYYRKNEEYIGLEEELVERKKTLEQLEKGKKKINQKVVILQEVLEKELEKKYNKKIPVHMICDEIEIRDEKWHDAIEGYLHTQKFYLLVEPKYFEECLAIYEKEKKEKKIYDVGLIDVEKIMERAPKSKKGSLAEEILCENPYIKAYMEYTLGHVMKVEKVVELRKEHIAITPTCMLYKGYVARQLHPSRYEVPYIGKSAIKKQIEMEIHHINRIKTLLEELQIEVTTYESLGKISTFGEDIIGEWGRCKDEILLLPKYRTVLEELKEKIHNLDKTNIIDLQMKADEFHKQIEEIEKKQVEKKVKVQVAKKEIQNIEEQELPRLISEAEQLSMENNVAFELKWVEEIGKEAFTKETAITSSMIKIIAKMQKKLEEANDKIDKQWEEVVELRSKYITLFRGTFSVQVRSNYEYDELLSKLEETELPKYKEKIESAIHIAKEQFQNDFLNKLRGNIDTVRDQINELNEALKNMTFGKDSYKFKISPNEHYREYYNMIMDPNLLEGINIFSALFQEKYGDVMDELFKKIIDLGEGALSVDERAEIEKNIEMYTDYRTYLDFDLKVTDARGNTSHLSKMITKKSGGETQTPFYISVLASFYRVYRMNVRSNDTARLIIFDEAFSKMDHERIEECIKLLKDLGFQALISAPSEKVANIAPLVDKTLCVIRTKGSTVIKEFTKEEMNRIVG